MSIDEKLLDRICPTDAINDCCEGGKNCSECDCILREMIVEHDKEVKDKVIDECIRIIEETVWKDADMLVEMIKELKEGGENE